MKKIIAIVTLVAIVALLLVGSAAMSARAADHLDAPLVRADGRIDITDIYAWQQDSADTVLVMNVNPFAGVLASSSTTFRPGARYDFRIDNNGDHVEDVIYRLQFSGARPDGSQNVTLKMLSGKQAQNGSDGGAVIAQGRTGTTLSVKGGGMLFTGLRDDPFFFDLNAFTKFQHDGNPADFCSPGSDFFAGANVTSIVLQVPTASLVGPSGPVIYPWATISLDQSDDRASKGKKDASEWVQVERMGKPALATVFIKPTGGANSDAYNMTRPVNDLARWGSFFPNNPIPLLGGITVRNLLLPDTLILNTSGPLVLNNIPFAGYPNGRRLQDDVIDTSFLVLSNAGVLPSNVTSDCVNSNDVPFMNTFPYLAAPH